MAGNPGECLSDQERAFLSFKRPSVPDKQTMEGHSSAVPGAQIDLNALRVALDRGTNISELLGGRSTADCDAAFRSVAGTAIQSRQWSVAAEALSRIHQS